MRQSPRAAVEATERLLRLGPADVKYVLRRSTRSRGIRATIDDRRGLVVSIPAGARAARRWRDPDAAVEAFLLERQAWVIRHLDRLERQRAEVLARGQARLVHYGGVLHRIRIVRDGAGMGRRSSVECDVDEPEGELRVRLAPGERRAPRRLVLDWFRDRAAGAVDEAVSRHAGALGVRPSRLDLRDPRTRWGSASRTGRVMLSWRLVMAPPGSLETVVVHELAHLRVFGHGPRFWDLVASRRPTHLADRAWLRRHSHALHAALDSAFEEVLADGA